MRSGCLYGIFMKHRSRNKRALEGNRPKPFNDLWTIPAPVELVKRDRLDRYRTSATAVSILLEHVDINGAVLDMCGSREDNIYAAFAERGPVMTNDIDVHVAVGEVVCCCCAVRLTAP